LAPASSPQTQADKYAWLLDHLGIDSCAIMGVSVGGPSTIEFALRHPRRCKALVLISSIVVRVRPAYLGILPEPALLSFLKSPAYRSILMRAPDRILLRLLGVTTQDEHRTSSDPGAAHALKETLLAARDPQGLRVHGALADMHSARHLPRYPFADLNTPSLAVHGSKDRFAPIRSTAEAIAEMPHGTLEEVTGAGHLCIITHSKEVSSQVTSFLRTALS
jgi:pimeloyl-ACP methyl ester carboxylesterase